MAYWDWALPLESALARLDARIASSTTIESLEIDGLRPSLALLEEPLRIRLDSNLEALASRLRIVRTIDAAAATAAVDHGKRLRDQSKAVKLGNISRERLTSVLRDEVDNERWRATQDSAVLPPPLDGLRSPDGEALHPSVFTKTVEQIEAFHGLRSTVSSRLFDALEPVTPEAKKEFISDCAALLSLDEAAFDNVCGPVRIILADALEHAESTISGIERGSGNDPPPQLELTSPPSDAAAAAPDLAQLKTRLTEYTRRQIADKTLELAQVDDLSEIERAQMTRALTNRIRLASRIYYEAAYQGHLARMVEVEAWLDSIWNKLAKANRAPMPSRLADPMALLEPRAAQRAFFEWTRLKNTLAEGLIYFHGDPWLQIGFESSSDMAGRLEAVLASAPERTDLSAVFNRLDTKELKALLTSEEAVLRRSVEMRLKEAKQRFGALPVSLDEWRGPRGPPRDPRLPRSHKIRSTLHQIVRNPTTFVQEMATFRAEHASFYEMLRSVSPEVAARWQFGSGNHYAWLMSQMSQADLAGLRLLVTSIRPTNGPSAMAPGWARVSAELDIIETEIKEEMLRRGSTLPELNADERPTSTRKVLASETALASRTPNGHPPTYPPGEPAKLRELALRWQTAERELRSSRNVTQLRVQAALELYPNKGLMPAALADDLRQSMENVLFAELQQLEQIVEKIDGNDGLNIKAARAIEVQDRAALAALSSSKSRAGEAVNLLAERLAMLERSGLIGADQNRWARIRRLSLRLGRIPPPSDPMAIRIAPDKPLNGGSGSAIAVRELTLDARLVSAADAIARADALLSGAGPIAQAEMRALPVGALQGRAIANRGKAPSGAVERILAVDVLPDVQRYPKGLKDWWGFFDEPKIGEIKFDEAKPGRQPQPFNFEFDVNNFRNFRGVGGGIHFGSHAVPDAQTAIKMENGAHLGYDMTRKTLRITLLSGETFEYGPVEPRVLKALYHFVTSYPGINLAITIGATGDAAFEHEDGQTPVLLDPSLVDTPVGQSLYLADILPWSLDQPFLPDGISKNPIADEFAAALEAHRDSEQRFVKDLVKIIGDIPPLSDVSRTQVEALVPRDIPMRAAIVAASSGETEADFRLMYAELREPEIRREVEQTPVFKDTLQVVSTNAEGFETAGFSTQDLEAAISLVQRGRRPNLLELGPGPGNIFVSEKALWLASTISPSDLQSLKIVVAYMKAPARDKRNVVYDRVFPNSARKRSIEAALKSFETLFDQEIRAQRALLVLRVAAVAGESKIEVPDHLLRLAAAAIKDLMQGESISDVARKLPSVFSSVTGLAVLFDSDATFSLQEQRLQVSANMRYRYATADYRLENRKLIVNLDAKDKRRPVMAREIDGVGQIATRHFAQLAAAFEPLGTVQEYAALAAFLRWSTCAAESRKTCQPRRGLTIDFSALGGVALRDRAVTPTPDAEQR